MAAYSVGVTKYEHLARDLMLWMKQDQNEDSWFTTMVDFYALPNNFQVARHGLWQVPRMIAPYTLRRSSVETLLGG